MNHTQTQNGQPPNDNLITREAQDGALDQEILDAVQAHYENPNSSAIKRNIEDLIARLKQIDRDQTRPRWDPSLEDLKHMSRGDQAQELWRLLNNGGMKIFHEWNFTPPDREWLNKPWLPRGRAGMFAGKSGSGKSLIGVELAASVATGGGKWEERGGIANAREWTGPGTPCPLPGVTGGSVVMASWEDEGEEVRRRLGWIEAAERKRGITERLVKRLKQNFTYVEMNRAGAVWGRHGPGPNTELSLTDSGRRLRDICEEMGACLLILDPLINAFRANENANEDAAAFFADWDGWGRDTVCTVLVIHHPGKNKNPENNADDSYRGASAWNAEARFHWELALPKDENKTDNDEQTATLICHKTSYGAKPKDPIELVKANATNWLWSPSASNPDTGDEDCHDPYD